MEVCLSSPGPAGKTLRPEKAAVKVLNEFRVEMILEGKWETAKCFRHEPDHLDCRVYLDIVLEGYKIES